jgi:3-mercaptopyruvate sulfurtransferase SseA
MSMRVRNALFPILMIVAGVTLMFGSVVWFVSAQEPEGVVSPSTVTMRIPHPDVARMSVQDAKAAFDIGNAIFIDTRGEPYYSQGHIPGALSITEDELPDRLDEFDPADWLITYCT